MGFHKKPVSGSWIMIFFLVKYFLYLYAQHLSISRKEIGFDFLLPFHHSVRVAQMVVVDVTFCSISSRKKKSHGTLASSHLSQGELQYISCTMCYLYELLENNSHTNTENIISISVITMHTNPEGTSWMYQLIRESFIKKDQKIYGILQQKKTGNSI